MSSTPKAPEGYVSQSSDIVGFWDPDEGPPIHFIPRFCRIFDSSIDPTKSSTLIVGELVDDCPVVDQNDKEVLATKGQKIGVWSKPGMNALKTLGGVKVYMYKSGEKDIGKPSPMKLFECMSKTQGAKLPLTGDYRKKSLPANGRQAPETAPDMVTDDIPF